MTTAFHKIGPNSFELTVQGKLEKQDYDLFIPPAEAAIEEHGDINLLINVPDTPRFTAAALWEDLKFDFAHFGDVARIAVVSEDASKEWLATVSKPFTAAEVRFFQAPRAEEARDWVRGQGS